MNRFCLSVVCLWSLVVVVQSQSPQNPPGAVVARPTGSREAVLDVYSRLTGKTILRSSTLPQTQDFEAQQLPNETNSAVAFIESRLRAQGIELIQDGPLFVRAVQEGWTNSPAAAFLATLKAPPEDKGSPKGTANFGSAGLEQVLSIYSRLRSRTLLRPRALPSSVLMLNTRRDMTNEQLGYGITVLLALNGIAAIDDGRKFVQVVSIHLWREVVAASPKTLPGVPVLDPNELPKLKPERPPATLDHLNRLYLQFFRQQPPWTPKPIDRLVEFYAELTEQKAAPSGNHGQLPVLFEVTTPLTKEEVLYAIEITLRLEGMAIASEGKNTIGVISLGEQRRLEREKAVGSEKR